MTMPGIVESHVQYNSVIADWDIRSAVRSRPRRRRADAEHLEQHFSLKLAPVAAHPLIQSRGPADVSAVLTHRLYSYMDFTTVLEQEIVNPVVLRLSRDAYGLRLPADARFDAHKIYCDEAYHAVLSVDIVRQACANSGIPPVRASDPEFGRVLRDEKASVRPELHGLVEFCATVVSETLISGSLTRIPADENVAQFIRDAVADHAADERTHHAYFTKVFEIAWPQLDREVRQELAPRFADFIKAFLAPDLVGQRVALGRLGLSRQDAMQVVAESHPAAQTLSDTRTAARATIKLLTRMGVLDDSRVADHFSELGLIGDSVPEADHLI